MQDFGYESGGRVSMGTADEQGRGSKEIHGSQEALGGQETQEAWGVHDTMEAVERPAERETPLAEDKFVEAALKFNEAALNEIKQQIAGLQDLFVRRLYDDKQKAALISSLEGKAAFAYMEPFLSDIILVLDRLEKAGPENLEFASSIADELYGILNRRGVERIKVTAQFNPAQNKAVRVEDDDTADMPRVSRVIRNGYIFDGKVIRPAEVVVVRKRRGS